MNRPEKGDGFPGQRIVVLPREVVARARQHPLLAGWLPTDIGYFPKAAGHLRERAAGVDQAIFIYCTQGAGWCEMAGQRKDVRAGDLLVVPPDTPHLYGADEKKPWTLAWFHVTGDHVLPLLAELGVSREAPALYLGEDPQLLALFEEALDVLEHGYAPAQLLYAARTLAHLAGAMIWHRRGHWRGEPDARQRIAQSIDYMKQHLAQPLRVSALAAMAHLSPSHYSALFRAQTGYSPIDYLIRLRMHLACQLLDTTALSVKDIAARLGYDDQLYFSRVFKAVNEVAPSDYRQTHKG
ncbi:MAG: AraC family transcriptional regulator [Verrucomicrobia bacterium]|nr:AraC family transcriptional regulator [Verrucomicrobiota bacterium]